MRKPAFCICENKDADQLRGNHEADQCEEGCVKKKELNKLVSLLRIAEGVVPAIYSCDYLTLKRPKRRIRVLNNSMNIMFKCSRQ